MNRSKRDKLQRMNRSKRDKRQRMNRSKRDKRQRMNRSNFVGLLGSGSVVLVELPSWMGLRVWGCRRWCACMHVCMYVCGFCPANTPLVGNPLVAKTLKVLWHAYVCMRMCV
jgi:hypothetical protein